jgi:4-hydroxy-tetrahydrodipicolinate synthase
MTSVIARVTSAERKAWAREVFRGGECSLLPSFKPGTLELDEEGVRHDVRQGIRQGFFSMFAASVGLEGEERRRFLQIATDEAGDEILISSGGSGRGSIEAAVAALRDIESLGCSHVMFSPPAGLSEDEAFAFSRDLLASTDLGAVLYAQRRQGGGPVPLSLFRRLAELPNVVAVKVTQVMDAVSTYQICDQLGDKLLIGPVNLEHVPLAAKVCPIQCTLMWQVDACQSPEKPYVVNYLAQIAGGRIDEAVETYRQMEPLVQLFWDEQAAVLRHGGHPWEHLKYHSWCVGANGGPLRPAAVHGLPPMTAEDRNRIREAYVACGIEVRDPEESFDAGRVNYRDSTSR